MAGLACWQHILLWLHGCGGAVLCGGLMAVGDEEGMKYRR